MSQSDFLGTGWKLPVSLSQNRVRMVAAEDSIKQSIFVILGTARGERVMRPDFGCDINTMAFELVNTTTFTLISFYVEEALMKWEPRIDVQKVNVFPEENKRNQLNINIDYIIKTNNANTNLVYPFYLEGRQS